MMLRYLSRLVFNMNHLLLSNYKRIQQKDYRIKMKTYNEQLIQSYSRPPRRASKKYTQIVDQQPSQQINNSKSFRKIIYPPKDIQQTYNNKQNTWLNSKSNANIKFAPQKSSLMKSKDKSCRERSSSIMNRSQVNYGPRKYPPYPNENKPKTRSRWQTTDYANGINYDHFANQADTITNDIVQQTRNKAYSKSRNFLQSHCRSLNQQNYFDKSGVTFNTRNQEQYPRFGFQNNNQLQNSKLQNKNTKSSKNIPLYERLKVYNNQTNFKNQEQSYLHKTISYNTNENHVQTAPDPYSQSAGNFKYDLYTSKASKKDLYSSVKLKNEDLQQVDLGLYKKPSLKNQIKEPELSDFIVGPCKGEGRFGKVFMAIHKKTGFVCALKKIKKQSVRYMIDQFIQQVKIQLFLNHPKLVKVYGYFADKEHFYMLVQYMQEGSLYSLMKKNKKFQEQEASEKLYEICQGIKQMHDQNIVHRDLKPQNVVLSNGVCKVCDFGWAAICQDRRQTYCGTLDYVCPEIVQGNAYDSGVDIWCIGVLAYQLMVGKAPFYDISRQKTIQKIKSCKIQSYPSHLSKKAISFIQMILKKNPDSRVGIQELLDSQFIRACKK